MQRNIITNIICKTCKQVLLQVLFAEHANKYYFFFLAFDLSLFRAGQRVQAAQEGAEPARRRRRALSAPLEPPAGQSRARHPLTRRRGARWRRHWAAPPSLAAAPGGRRGPAAAQPPPATAANRPRRLGAVARPPRRRRRAARGLVLPGCRGASAQAALPSPRRRSPARRRRSRSRSRPARRPLPGPGLGGPARSPGAGRAGRRRGGRSFSAPCPPVCEAGASHGITEWARLESATVVIWSKLSAQAGCFKGGRVK